MATRIYLIRHAETEVTLEDRFAGVRDLPLAPEGREHAEELATRLKGFRIDAVYASPLMRTMETARRVADEHGLTVTPVDALREISHGHWEGMTRAEVEEKYPDEYAAYERDPLDFAPEGGESAGSVIARAAPALLEIVRAHPDQDVAVVSHKATNRLLISYFLGIDPKRYRDKLGQRPTCLNVLDFTGEAQVRLMLLNDISHYSICAPLDSPFFV
ncbi:MAG: histidine phosphatase family protein [Anaerolineae bacterium]